MSLDEENSTVYLPQKVLSNIKDISFGGNFSTAITNNGELYVWGCNKHGELGNNTTIGSSTPMKVMDNVKSVCAGDNKVIAITENGSLYTWGEYYNTDGILEEKHEPTKVMSGIRDATTFNGAIASITNHGDLYVWGRSDYMTDTFYGEIVQTKIEIPPSISDARSFSKQQDDQLMIALFNKNESSENNDDDADINLLNDAMHGSYIDGKAVFNSLDANELYNIYEIKSKDTEDILYSENLLYIAQTTADKNGNIAYPYEPREDYADSILFAVSKKAASSNPSTGEDDILPEDMPIDGIIPEGLWIAGITDYSYIGEAIKPEMRVYDNKKLLTEKTDYTIAYKNNLNVGKATITVTGKGNYSGKETATFNILPADISGDDFSAEEFYVKVNPKAQYPIPELYYMGTKLKHKKDFTIKYSNTSGVYAQAGEYSAIITGTGNYTGTREIILTAVKTIAKKSSVNIAKASLVGFEKSFSYTGKAHKQECTLYIKTSEGEKALTEGVDYTARYANNIKAGTATVTYSGKNGYTGKLKKTYKITPYNISDDYEAKITYENYFECVYAKGGSKPKPVITFDQKVMKEGVDYTLSYKNNKEVYGKQTPCVVVNGKGSFKGKIPIYFTITSQDLSKMTLVSCDRVYKNKVGNHKIVPKLMDLDGKLLSAGKDFDKNNITYTYENDVTLENGIEKKAGDPVGDTDILPADTQIRVAFGCGTGNNYTGTFTGVYRVVKADIKSAKVTIPNQTYTGKEIILDKSQITVTLSGTTLKPEDYEILQYTDNVKKGKASVTIKGNGNYGGMKTVKFNIGAKRFLWWKK